MSDVVGGRYRVMGVIGQGTMGVVWRAYDQLLDREVALKELRPPVGVDPADAIDRFLVEARAAARLSHPSILTVHDVVADGGRVLLAMELLEGPTLATVIGAGGLGSAARPVLTQIAGALAEAHAQGVVHRDLKPENVFWLATGRVVVCDFGLARIGAGRGTRAGTVMGTPGYMAPEQIRGEEVSPATDVFAWGVVGFELVSGSPPFGDPAMVSEVTLSWRVVEQAVPSLWVEDDPALGELIGQALAKDANLRPRDGAALVAALTAGPPSASRAPAVPLTRGNTGRSDRGAPMARSHGLLWAGLGLAAAVLALIAILVVSVAGGKGEKVEFAAATTRSSVPSTEPVTSSSARPTTTTATTLFVPTFDDVTAPGITHPDIAGVMELFQAYASGINTGDYGSAYSRLSPDAQTRTSYTKFVAGNQTSIVSSIVISSLATTGIDRDEAEVSFISRQDPGDSANGAPCTSWSIHYTLVRGLDGKWRIDRATNNVGSPGPC